MMRIGVISDTHIPKTANDLPKAVYDAFEKVDMIIHAGDFADLTVLENLRKIAPVKAVYGNMDAQEIVRALNKKEIIQVGKLKIGLIHGWGPPKGLLKLVAGEFDKNIDAIIFGHSHAALNERIGSTLFFNPGSPTDKIFAAFSSYGIIEVNTKIKGEIIKI